MRNTYTKISPYQADGGEIIGKRPSELTREELEDLGHPQSPVKAIRAKCRDCVYSDTEVMKCVQYTCPLWPMRLGKNVFHTRARKTKDG